MPRIAVAGPSSVVIDAAVVMGESGGSVVDVAIVAALTAMCTEPGICGPGGGGFLTIDIPGGPAVVVDGYMAYPGKGFNGEIRLREVTMDYGGGVTTLVDAGSIAVPGIFAGFAMASEMFGVAPWRLVMETVADAVAEGFPLSSACHLYLNDGAAPIYMSDPVARSALFAGETSRPLGSTILFPGLADTLRYIGSAGVDVLYQGDLAETIVADLADRGAQLTREDMASYRAIARPPLVAGLDDWALSLNPEPAVGGVMAARVLELAANDGSFSWSQALVAAFQERRTSSIRSPSTISIAAADEKGGVAAVSCSAGYGSGIIPIGTGMLMNNALGELELVTGRGEPGERMISNMAPTVARAGNDAVAIGSPGADRITTAVTTTLRRLAAGDGLREAIDHPRAHPEFGDFGIRIATEPGQDLDEIDFDVREFEGPHMYFGGVNGAAVLGGSLTAYADTRRTGSVGIATP